MDWRHLTHLLQAAEPVYGGMKQMCVWVKDNAGMGTFYRSQHEVIAVFKKGNKPHINNFKLGETGRYRSNVWNYRGVNSFHSKRREELDMHPTVKPLSLVADAIRDCSRRNGLILDCFSGSGTTIMAAQRTGRRARCIELDPKYVDVTIARWHRSIELPVIHVDSGLTFAEISRERNSKI